MAIGMIFSGQGAQTVGMGKSLYENSPIARDLYDRADSALGWSLKDICFNGPDETLTETRVCQPALFMVGYSIYAILKDAGKLDMGAALGLSLGELTALTVADAFDFETGLKVVAERGRLMQLACDETDGAMASIIGGTREQVEPLCSQFDIDMANLNCPGQIVISGDSAKVAAAVEFAKESKLFRMVVPLKVAGAYHSRLMEPARAAFETYLAGVDIKTPSVPVFTNTTGKQVSQPDEIRSALVKQVVSSVLWEDCMHSAAALGLSEFYECGPGGVLAGMAKRTNKAWTVRSLSEFSDLPL
ncbi:MAG: ACP S-malonyltransferase [Opitutales bacterium]|nr:ACP S-malonyltransferase [Opitutales bacterium]